MYYTISEIHLTLELREPVTSERDSTTSERGFKESKLHKSTSERREMSPYEISTPMAHRATRKQDKNHIHVHVDKFCCSFQCKQNMVHVSLPWTTAFKRISKEGETAA